ncbi:Cellulose synthase-like protein D2 [Hibiscus syriacus]|uniref:Cellulose synthase-like protein D2 n=1 Tax=Hibiscus syriacus TaxID=106335 RepID=A0A6A3A512_HIBSY|nr:Cellulose synthase-like protein D2 [Hibiscus syriacus]
MHAGESRVTDANLVRKRCAWKLHVWWRQSVGCRNPNLLFSLRGPLSIGPQVKYGPGSKGNSLVELNEMTSKSYKGRRSSLSISSEAAESQKFPIPPSVTLGRRTSFGRYVSYSRDDLDSELGSTDFMNYTVHIPPPLPTNPWSLLYLKSKPSQMAGAKVSSCAVPGCDAKVMNDERLKSGGGMCPGCKEPYKNTGLDETAVVNNSRPLPLPPPGSMSKMERRLSLMKPTKSALMRSQTGDFDHNLRLFETRGTYDCFWLGGSSIQTTMLFGYGECLWHRCLCLYCRSPLVTASTILSILVADYPVEKLACYVSDDGGALLTFEAMAEAASFANSWVPFCRKHDIEPRKPESYFNLKRDPYKNKVKPDFVKDRRPVKHEYDEFKAMKLQRQNREDEPVETLKIPKATWMADGTHWPGTWLNPASEHSRGDHAGITQVLLKPPSDEPLHGTAEDRLNDLTDIDIRLPLLVYVSREKRPGYDHNKKAGAMNALVRASAIMFNGSFILNLDCDHYIYNSQAMREGMCFMMDRGGDRLCYVQFPQRFEGIDPSDRYANNNTVFFDVNMRALDGLMGPVYVGTGCLFRTVALYGFDPPRSKEQHSGCCRCCFFSRKKKHSSMAHSSEENRALRMGDSDGEEMNLSLLPKRVGNSTFLIDSIPVAEFQGRPLADHPAVKNGHPPGALTIPHDLLDASTVAEAISVISCCPRMKFLQRIAYLNVGIYPFTSIFLIVYCLLPALSLFSGQFIVQTLNVTFLTYLLIITVTLCLLALLEIKWSGIELEEWRRNEQFWLIGGTSAYLAAGIEISFTLTYISRVQLNDIQCYSAVESTTRWTFLQFLGSGSSLSFRERTYGKKREDAYHLFRVVGSYGHHHIPPLGGNQSTIEHEPDWRIVPVPLMVMGIFTLAEI